MVVAGGGTARTDNARERIDIDFAEAGSRGDTRAVARNRDGDVLVSDARSGALGVELRIILIGLDQRRFQRIGGGWLHEQPCKRTGGEKCHLYAPGYRTWTLTRNHTHPEHARLPRPEI